MGGGGGWVGWVGFGLGWFWLGLGWVEGIGKSPSKLDLSRILSMNEHYIKHMNENDLFDNLTKYCEIYKDKIDNKSEKVKKSLSFLKNKAKTLEDISWR